MDGIIGWLDWEDCEKCHHFSEAGGCAVADEVQLLCEGDMVRCGSFEPRADSESVTALSPLPGQMELFDSP